MSKNTNKITFDHETEDITKIVQVPAELEESDEHTKALECLSFAIDLSNGDKSPAWVLALVLVLIGGGVYNDTVNKPTKLAEWLYENCSDKDINDVAQIFMSETLEKRGEGMPDIEEMLASLPPELADKLRELNPNK